MKTEPFGGNIPALSYLALFFWASWENLQMMPPALGVDGAEDSVRLPMTKNPARSFSCPWCQVHGISFERQTSYAKCGTMINLCTSIRGNSLLA